MPAISTLGDPRYHPAPGPGRDQRRRGHRAGARSGRDKPRGATADPRSDGLRSLSARGAAAPQLYARGDLRGADAAAAGDRARLLLRPGAVRAAICCQSACATTAEHGSAGRSAPATPNWRAARCKDEPQRPDRARRRRFVLSFVEDDIASVLPMSDRALELNPGYAPGTSARHLRARRRSRRHRPNARGGRCSSACASGPVLDLILAAFAHLMKRDYAAAIPVLASLVREFPNFTESYRQLAAAYALDGQLARARATTTLAAGDDVRGSAGCRMPRRSGGQRIASFIFPACGWRWARAKARGGCASLAEARAFTPGQAPAWASRRISLQLGSMQEPYFVPARSAAPRSRRRSRRPAAGDQPVKGAEADVPKQAQTGCAPGIGGESAAPGGRQRPRRFPGMHRPADQARRSRAG